MAGVRCLLTRLWLMVGSMAWAAPPLVQAAEPVPVADGRDEGFVPLFESTKLAGWEALEGSLEAWSVAEGRLTCAGGTGWLRTTQMHSDFVLRFEISISPGGKGSVGLRLPADRRAPVRPMFEFELRDDGRGEVAAVMNTPRE